MSETFFRKRILRKICNSKTKKNWYFCTVKKHFIVHNNESDPSLSDNFISLFIAIYCSCRVMQFAKKDQCPIVISDIGSAPLMSLKLFRFLLNSNTKGDVICVVALMSILFYCCFHFVRKHICQCEN